MRNILITLLLLTLYGCGEPVVKKPFTIRMQKITGDWVTKTYILPENIMFYIKTHKGSYKLEYIERDAPFGLTTQFGTIKVGVIDFEIINK
jgi:hypothetical protein